LSTHRHPRGISIVEAMVSLGIMAAGALGVMAVHNRSQAQLADSMHIVRATVVANDLLAQVEAWDFADPRLANSNASNDLDLGDVAYAFGTASNPPADHGEADLTGLGTPWRGLPTSEVRDYGLERYLNVAYVDDVNTNAAWDAARVAVIVRWPVPGGWRRLVVTGVKRNAGDAQ
jgi:hypothetical protein